MPSRRSALPLAFAVVLGMMALFVWGRIRYDVVALLALLASLATGIVPPEEAFSGFSDDVVIPELPPIEVTSKDEVREVASGIEDGVATVGELEVEPGAANVVPSRVQLTVDARARSKRLLRWPAPSTSARDCAHSCCSSAGRWPRTSCSARTS